MPWWTAISSRGRPNDGGTNGRYAAACAALGELSAKEANGVTLLPTTLLEDQRTGYQFTPGQLQTFFSASPIVLTNIAATAYTLNGSEAGSFLNFTSMDAITLTIPPDSDEVDFNIGDSISIVQGGSGAILFAAGAGVTINSFNGVSQTAGPFATAGITKTAPNTWLLAGSLVIV